MSLSSELQNRGFINQYSGESLTAILDGERRTVYHGIDPTADSAHAGNFVNWMLLRHLAEAGHKIIFLVGGGTGMIGDPKTDAERPTADPQQLAKNVEKLKVQAEQLFQGYEVEFVNNADWLTDLHLIDFLRDTGKNFTINELIKKEAIASRLGSEKGISYTEFAYPLLQAYDYLVLYRDFGCDLQVGGSDQWGNMISGADLIRRKEGVTTHVLTVPLIVDKTTGKKFGKSEGNAVWLNAEKTTPYQFYQFWLNTADENVFDYLKLYTLLPISEIEEINQRFQLNPGAREAQRTLAFTVTEIVHGTHTANLVREASEILFGGGGILEVEDELRALVLENAPTQTISQETPLTDLLVVADLASSKREARTFIMSGAIKVNGVAVTDEAYIITKQDFKNNLLPLSRGKKRFMIVVWD